MDVPRTIQRSRNKDALLPQVLKHLVSQISEVCCEHYSEVLVGF